MSRREAARTSLKINNQKSEPSSLLAQSTGGTETSLFDNYQTPEALSGELRISPRTLDRWHRLGEGPPRCKVGRRVLYRRSSVAAWLMSREQASA